MALPNRLRIQLKFTWQDMWIGAYVRIERHYQLGFGPVIGGWHRFYDIYLCLVPCFPIHISWNRRIVDAEES